MGLPELLPLFAQTGVLGVFGWVLYRFFRSAINAHAAVADAHRQRADDWKAAYDAQVARADVRDAQVDHMLTAIKTAAASEHRGSP